MENTNYLSQDKIAILDHTASMYTISTHSMTIATLSRKHLVLLCPFYFVQLHSGLFLYLLCHKSIKCIAWAADIVSSVTSPALFSL